MQTINLSNQMHEISITKLAVGHNGLVEGNDFAKWYLDAYLDAGGNCIDTARIYNDGHAEKAVGQYLRDKPRDKFVLVTKCVCHDYWLDYPPSRVTAENIRSDVDTSLRELNLDYIDILLLHRDDIKRPVEEIMPVLHEYVKAGKVRLIGASNWTGARIAKANNFALENGLTPFSVNQVYYSLGLMTAASSDDWTHIIMDEVEHSWHADANFPVMAWTAAARGFFSKVAAGVELDQMSERHYSWLPENFRRVERVKTLAAELGASIGAVVLAYLMCDPNVRTCAVTAFSRHAQYNEAIEATELVLTQKQRMFLEGRGNLI